MSKLHKRRQTSTFALERDVALRGLDGQPVQLFAESLRYEAVGEERGVVTLRCRVAGPTFAAVVDGGVFNTSPLVGVPPAVDPGFDRNTPVWLELELRPAISRGLFNAEDAAAVFFDELKPWGMRETEAWRLRDATQAVAMPDDVEGEAFVGYQTGWATPQQAAALSIVEVVDSALAAEARTAERLSATLVRSRASVGERQWLVMIRTDDAVGVVAVYSIFPALVPLARRAEASLTLTSLTRELEVSALEIDLDDGEIRLRTGIDTGGSSLPPALFLRLLGRNSEAMNDLWATLESLTTPLE